jgi:hypothetical protein
VTEKRLRDDPSALTADERRALSGDGAFHAPEGAKDAVWRAISASVPSGSGDAADGSGAGGEGAGPGVGEGAGLADGSIVAAEAKAAAWLAWSKGILLTSVIVTAGGVGVSLSMRSTVPPPDAQVVAASVTKPTASVRTQPMSVPSASGLPVPAASASAAPRIHPTGSNDPAPLFAMNPSPELEVAPQAQEETPPRAPPDVTSAAVASAAVAPAAVASPAVEEARLVAEVREAVRAGRGTEALALLADLQRRFPGGVLGQEREILEIEALAAAGRRAVASARAEAFLRAHPESPLGARIRGFVRP